MRPFKNAAGSEGGEQACLGRPRGRHRIYRVKLNRRNSDNGTFSEWETLIWYSYLIRKKIKMDMISYSQVNRNSYLNASILRLITLYTSKLTPRTGWGIL